MQSSISSYKKVDDFVRKNLFWIAQRDHRWLYPESQNPTEKILFEKYIQYTFKTVKTWRKKLSEADRWIYARRFDAAIRTWLEKYYPTRTRFVYGEEVFYDGQKENEDDIIEPYECLCEDNCIAFCPNRAMDVECDNRCRSGDSCLNKEGQQPFDWQSLLAVKYVNKKTGAGLFALRDIAQDTYLGRVAGFALSKDGTSQVIAGGGGSYLFNVSEKSQSLVVSINPHRYGNHLRFVNHHCAPNSAPFRSISQGRMIIKFYSLRTIHEVKKIFKLCL